MRTFRLLLLGLCLACAHDKDPKTPDKTRYEEVADRLLPMLDAGWVVSRGPDGSALDQGDSLLFTGLAMGSLDCGRGTVLETALQTTLRDNHGVPYRHPSLPDSYSLDGLLGLWWGIDARTKACPASAAGWAALLPEHAAAVHIEPLFKTALQQVMANLGVADAPSPTARGELGGEVGDWAVLVANQHAAGYRLHLGYLTLSLVDAPKGKAVFCWAAKEAKIALIEHACGRDGLAAWVDGFTYDRFVYAFQRASWEGEENHPGRKTPAIDLLMALKTQ